ncbi:MAG: hypothetical protein GX031_11810, partial [Candidatus Riflebacteria bacterium]|nr:hypothetical protein [Candidatus Riflebacteria bacterium]
GTGTAASISPVGSLKYLDADYIVNSRKVGPVSQNLYDNLLKIQYGEIPEPFPGWTVELEGPEDKALSI